MEGGAKREFGSDDKKVEAEAFGCVLTRPLRVPQHFSSVSTYLRQYDSRLISHQVFQRKHHTIRQGTHLTPSVRDKALTSNMSASTSVRRSSRRAAAKGTRNRNTNDSEVRITVPSSSSPLVVSRVVGLWRCGIEVSGERRIPIGIRRGTHQSGGARVYRHDSRFYTHPHLEDVWRMTFLLRESH